MVLFPTVIIGIDIFTIEYTFFIMAESIIWPKKLVKLRKNSIFPFLG